MDLFRPNVERMAARSDVQGLARLLDHPKSEIRSEAATALGQLGVGETAEPLGRVLIAETDPEVAACAATALTQLGSAGSSVLAQAVRGEGVGAIGTGAAVDALWLTGPKPLDEPVIDSLIHFFRSGRLPQNRERALQKLVGLTDLGLSSVLNEALADDSAGVRIIAVDAIVRKCGHAPHNRSRLPGVNRAPDPIQMPRPEPVAEDNPSRSIPVSVQARCAVADQRFDWAVRLGSAAVEPLSWLATTAYTGDQPGRLSQVVRALAAIGDPTSVTVFDGLLDLALADSDEGKAVNLIETMVECGVPRAIDHLARVRPMTGHERKTAATRELIRAGGPAAIAPIVETLRSGALDGDTGMRRAAVGQLAALGTDECVEGLSVALRDSDPTIVTEAVQGLGRIESEPAQAALRNELDRTERELASMQTRWEPWKDWDPQRRHDEDDSPGHSTYRMERDERQALAETIAKLNTTQTMLQEALGRGTVPEEAE
jgi:HEAT repeat protein